jgi:hypothetical protein
MLTDPMCASARSAIAARRPGDQLVAIAAMAHDGRFFQAAADSCSLVPASARDKADSRDVTDELHRRATIPAIGPARRKEVLPR